MDFKGLASIGGQFPSVRQVSDGKVLDDFMSSASNGSTRRPATHSREERKVVSRDGVERRRVIDSVSKTTENMRQKVSDEKKSRADERKRVVDSITAEELVGMKRKERREILGSVNYARRKELIAGMKAVKVADSKKRVADAFEDESENSRKMKLLNLVVLSNNVVKEDTEFTRNNLAKCVEGLPEDYADYIYSKIDGDESNLSEERYEEIEGELKSVANEFGMSDLITDSVRPQKVRVKKVTDSALDDVMDAPSDSDKIDRLLRSIGNFMKTGNVEELEDVREEFVGVGDTGSSDDEDEDEVSEEEKEGFEDELSGDEDDLGEGTEELGLPDDDDEISSEDEDNDDDEEYGLGKDTDSEEIELDIPENTPEEVVNLVQNLLDILSESKIEDSAKTLKFIKDSIDMLGEGESSSDLADACKWKGDSTLELQECTPVENMLVRVPLSYEEYQGLANKDVREDEVKAVMPTYVCPDGNIETCNKRCIKVVGKDGKVNYWTPICGSVGDTLPTSVDEVSKLYVPTIEFARYATNLNQLDLVDSRFYKQLVEDACWYVKDDIEEYGLKSGDCIIPSNEGEVVIMDKRYSKK